VQEFWTLAAIAKRMNWRDRKTPIKKMLNEGFPMYRRRRGSHPRPVWHTNDGLIARWEWSRVQVELERLKNREVEKKARKRPSEGDGMGAAS